MEEEAALVPGVAVETAAVSSLEMTYPVLGVLRSPGTGPVAWKAGGDVVRVWVVEGDVVDDGDPLAAVDCEIPAFERARALVAQEGSEVARDLTARRLARLEAVGGSGGVTGESLDLARSALAGARLDSDAAAIALGLADRAVRDCTVTAPFAARVEVVVPRVGATVAPGAPMATLLPLSGLRLEVDLVPEVAASLGEGTLLTDDLGRLWTLAHAGAVVDRSSGSVRTIWLPEEEVGAADGIWLGGRILRETRTGVVVPVGALVDKGGLGVFIVGPDLTLEFRLVLQVASVAGRTLVEGVLPGELVVVARPGRMEDGDLVTILEG
ncbi:hypothetical protein IIA16_02495 [bacterium]|nr:hypothetical protein [bacterium]